MKWRSWLEEWGMTSLTIKTPFLEMEWEPKIQDIEAAWELYIELLTRTTTQDLLDEYGDEKSALESIYKIFPLTREIIKKYKRDCMEFTKIAIVVLNQKIRPFTSKWHKRTINGLNDTDKFEFREELKELQQILKIYTKMLGNMAGVEEINDLTMLSEESV